MSRLLSSKRIGFCLMALLLGLFVVTAAFPALALADEPAASKNRWHHYTRFGAPDPSSLIACADGTFLRIDFYDNTPTFERYDADYNFIGAVDVPSSTYTPSDIDPAQNLLWGGAFETQDSIYLVTGQKNTAEDASRVVYRVSRYTKDMQFIAACELRGENTRDPFNCGSCALIEANGTLYLHSCHQMFTTSDGKNHQASVMFLIDKATMTKTNGFSGIGNNNLALGYVSHSFNQYLTTLDGSVYALDQGDSYPRAATIKKVGASGAASHIEILPFAGSTGANDTYATIGGFESSATQNTLLSAGSSIDQEAATTATNSYKMTVNAWLSVTSADLTQNRFIWLSDYEEGGSYNASNPILAKVDENKFLVAWEERLTGTGVIGIRYVFVDGDGNALTETLFDEEHLAKERPAISNGKLIWYTTGKIADTSSYSTSDVASKPIFYELSLSSPYGISKGPIDISDGWAAFTGDKVYTGDPITIEESVLYDRAPLVRGIDYEIEFTDNVDAGEAHAVIAGKGTYTGRLSVPFTIEQRYISATQISPIPSQSYTGKEIIPNIVVTYNGITLNEGTDYTVALTNNIGPSANARVTITGMGNFRGTKTTSFWIGSAPSGTPSVLAFCNGVDIISFPPKAMPSTTGPICYKGQPMYWLPDKNRWALVVAAGTESPTASDFTAPYSANSAFTTISKPGYPSLDRAAGDVNGSGQVNIVDAQIAYDMAMGRFELDALSQEAWLMADVTGDLALDAADARAIQSAALTDWAIS